MSKLTEFYRIIVLISSIVCLTFFFVILSNEKFGNDWRKHQSEYQQLLQTKNNSIENINREIRQIVLKDLNIVDRCPSCHLGVKNLQMREALSPYKSHEIILLQNHSIEKFGCTLCHRGKGRVLRVQEVCTGAHIKESIYSLEYIQSSCGKCHLAIFQKNLPIAGTEKLLRGLGIFRREGCLGCHKVRKVGGTIGPDLTDQGNKIKEAYSFTRVEGEPTIPNWLKMHFINPDKVSPGSQMLAFDLQPAELDALTTFTLGLFKPDLPLDYYSFANLREFKSRRNILEGEEVYALFCAACHGKNGEGKDYKLNKFGVPTLNNPDFQSVASRELLEFTVIHGRGNRQMASWIPHLSGLTQEEIHGVTKQIRIWRPAAPSFEEFQVSKGNSHEGGEIYKKHCSMCHGLNGQEGIAPMLNNQDFLSLASDRFLYLTLILGRSNTAMPSWSRFLLQEIKGIVRYIRSWQKISFKKYIDPQIQGNMNNGQHLYDHLCIRCHGIYGSGGIGPAIMNRNFLQAASDQYLFQTIYHGRGHSAMFGWSKDLGKLERLQSEYINDLVTYIRAFQDSVLEIIYPGESEGKPEKGKTLYSKYCSECHGSNGEGKQAPALNNQEFLNAATNGFILATISLGREGTAMPSWGRGSREYRVLTGEERQDIVAHIRTLHQLVIRR